MIAGTIRRYKDEEKIDAPKYWSKIKIELRTAGNLNNQKKVPNCFGTFQPRL